MTKACHEIVTDAEVERVHANANFGSMGKREVVDDGVLTYAFGYSSGHTMMQILQEHGLLSRSWTNRALTQKGYHYLRAMFQGVRLEQINASRNTLARDGVPDRMEGQICCECRQPAEDANQACKYPGNHGRPIGADNCDYM